MSKSKIMLLAGAAAIATAIPIMASAQTTPDNAPGTIETVVVTARKRSEDILKVPGNVTAMTGVALQQRGIESISDIATYTPGVADDQASGGSARSDRSFQEIIIRGMTPSITTNPTTSIFINGVAVPSDMVQTLDNPDRVEILKGPQSAYFGRETFAGAVNFITKQPTNHYSADLNVTAGTRNTYEVSGDVSGPIVDDKLMVIFGGKYDTHSGSYQNAYDPSHTLGDQSDRSVHVGVVYKPTADFDMKFFGMWFENDDGPSATGLLLANGPGKFNQGNCTIQGTPFICGTLPSINYSVSPAQNTTVTPALASFLAAPGGILNANTVIHKFGLKRDAEHADLTVDYTVPGLNLTFTNLFGVNQDNWSEVSDLSDIDSAAAGQYPGYGLVPGVYNGFPYMVQAINQNISEEFRIATDTSKPYRGLVGVSYIATNSNQVIGVTAVSLTPNPSGSTTSGVFFSLAWDILPQLTVNFDGRYQDDHEVAYTGAHQVLVAGDSYNFLPRASIQYKFTPDVMTYFTYSQGANPGTFNTTYGNLPAASKAEIAADGYSVGVATLPELITNYEIGIKGRFLDGRATLSADVYYDEWTHQLNSTSFVFQASDPANPINIPGSPVYNPVLPSADPISFTSNAAASNPKGVEFEGQLIPVDHVTLNASFSYNDTQYTSFICTACQPYTSYNAKGKYLPDAPLFSSAIGAMYSNTIHAFARPIDWFARIDYIHRDGVFLQPDNVSKTPPTDLVNLRGGLTLGHGLSIEGYVDNLTNEKSPVAGFQAYNFPAGFTNTAFDLTLPQLITGGVTLRYKY